MSRDDIQKLLGGYATGTLTSEEQQALFEAALDDQELFDTLAREQALRDLLRDPAAKAHLLAALDHRPPRWYELLFRGWRPLAAGVAMAGVAAIAVVAVRQSGRPLQPVLVARVTPPPAVSIPSADAEPAPAAPDAAKQPLATPAARDTNALAIRDRDALLGRLAKESPAKVASGADGVPEEDRRAKGKQVAQSLKRKDVADSVTGTPPVSKGEAAPLPAGPPMPPPTFASGFREGPAPPVANGDLGGMPRAPEPIAEPQPAPPIRSATGNAPGRALGGTVGGVLGGVIGGVPGPPPPAPQPKAEAQPSQSAQSQGAPSQSTPSQFPQGQQGAPSQSPSLQLGQSQGSPSPLDRVRLAQQQAASAETVEVTAAASSLDALSIQDVKSLFYGYSADSSNAPGARGGGAGSGDYPSAQPAPPAQARKRAADQPEQTQAGRQAIMVNAITANPRAQTRLLNLGVRYSMLRKTVAGAFEPVDPDNVKTGDTLELQLTSNYSGSLSVKGRSGDGPWQDVMSRRVEARLPYTTKPLKSGEKELQVILTRLPVPLTGVSLRDDKRSTVVSQQSTAEPATYVVTAPASPQLLFTITLNYK